MVVIRHIVQHDEDKTGLHGLCVKLSGRQHMQHEGTRRCEVYYITARKTIPSIRDGFLKFFSLGWTWNTLVVCQAETLVTKEKRG